ncbi:hypothetical protein PIB30_001423 [Stylosanthes scabra]|uniref:Uncharacterized protein n=1 Tax=Stylosanthes scabra TaxID=79078 RepID=A0ABU6Z0M2_9FABA|nr:hypothetical protein [Stylosanthes scabra]
MQLGCLMQYLEDPPKDNVLQNLPSDLLLGTISSTSASREKLNVPSGGLGLPE